MAEAHLSALANLGPRWPGSEEQADARAYVARELAVFGAEVLPEMSSRRGHLVARIPGRSTDQVLVVLPLASLGSMSWIDDSGLALGMELARVFGARVNAYELVLVFAAVDAPRESGTSDQDSKGEGFVEIESPSEARQLVAAAGEALLEALEAIDGVDLLAARAVIVMEPQTHHTMRIARDLPSHPVFRDLFWETASALGHAATFPEDAAWASPIGLQGAFRSAGIGRLLAVVDESTILASRVARVPDQQAGKGSDASARLAPLGSVTLKALTRLMERFERIDAFSE